MVSKNGEGVPSQTQIVSPMGKGFHHGKQLSFVNIIVAFGRSEGGRVVRDGVELGLSLFVGWSVPLASFLGEYCPNPVRRGISLEIEVLFEVGLDEDWFSAHEGFERFEGFELSLAPVPYQVFLGQI